MAKVGQLFKRHSVARMPCDLLTKSPIRTAHRTLSVNLCGCPSGWPVPGRAEILADAILDRLVHNAHRLKLTGESMRKAAARNTSLDLSAQA